MTTVAFIIGLFLGYQFANYEVPECTCGNEECGGGCIQMPKSRLFGFSEVWRRNGTGTRTFFLFCLPIWSRAFNHSTHWR